MMTKGEREEPRAMRSHVRSLQHGLQILDLFSHEKHTVSVGEIAKELELHKSSASRLAMTLASLSYLAPTSVAGRYHLGTKITTLQQFMPNVTDVERVALPRLRELVERTGETGHVARLAGTEAVSTAIVDGWHTVRMHSWVGKHSAAYVSSMGKCLLANKSAEQLAAIYSQKLPPFTENTVATVEQLVEQLSAIRLNGYSIDDEELEIGLRCIGAPIFDVRGDVVASVSISGPSSRITRESAILLAALVRRCAFEASEGLGAPDIPPGWSSTPIGVAPELPWVDAARLQRG
jgi:DNA-binding IclR family transcriptional regulator